MQAGSPVSSQLNLARKWRSKQFGQVVGQETAVRLIKNGLYRNLIFPVYLLSGMRGCGKTTMGRLFAAALNCEQLPHFQKNPQGIELPCLSCLSCQTMQQGSHPDFIELDAASHTGVDSIRGLIESASFSPLMGRKKIYLIDEAHMLSKAAFNALLKVLEEPPASVAFLLATTDPHKVIDTVRSRCFQLFFSPLNPESLARHLENICQEEKIGYTSQALQLIAHETEGSVRDAINLLERARLAGQTVSQEAVLNLLGFCSEENIILLLRTVLQGEPQALFAMVSGLAQFDVAVLWKKLVELIRLCLWWQVGVQVSSSFLAVDEIKDLLQYTNHDHLVKLLALCYEHELSFSKTSLPHGMFELLLIKMVNVKKNNESSHPVNTTTSSVAQTKSEPKVVVQEKKIEKIPEKTVPKTGWEGFVAAIATLEDPLISSIFKQARLVGVTGTHVQLAFAQDVTFFGDWLEGSAKSWKPLLAQFFGPNATCSYQFIDEVQSRQPSIKPAEPAPTVQPRQAVEAKTYQSYYKASSSKEMSIDIKDSARWRKVHMVLKLFPGIVSQIIS